MLKGREAVRSYTRLLGMVRGVDAGRGEGRALPVHLAALGAEHSGEGQDHAELCEHE